MDKFISLMEGEPLNHTFEMVMHYITSILTNISIWVLFSTLIFFCVRKIYRWIKEDKDKDKNA